MSTKTHLLLYWFLFAENTNLLNKGLLIISGFHLTNSHSECIFLITEELNLDPAAAYQAVEILQK